MKTTAVWSTSMTVASCFANDLICSVAFLAPFLIALPACFAPSFTRWENSLAFTSSIFSAVFLPSYPSQHGQTLTFDSLICLFTFTAPSRIISPPLLQVASNRLEHVLFPVLRLSTPHFHSQCKPFSPVYNAHRVTINVQILDRGLRFRIHCSLLIIPQKGCKYIPIRPVECSIGITPDARKTVRKTLIHTIKPLTTSIHIYTQHNCSAMLSLPNT